MARNVARNSAQRPGSHGGRVVRGLTGGRKFSSIKPKFRTGFGRAEDTRSEVGSPVDWQHLPGPFLGAGNTYSAAFTACLARGMDAPQALVLAQEYTTGALEHAQRFGMGKFIPSKFFRP